MICKRQNKMEEYVNAEPEILIRDFIETYRNFLEKLEDPQVLLCLSDVEDNQARGGATLSASGGKETIQDTQRKVAWLLSQLKAAYDKRLNMIQLDFKEDVSSEIGEKDAKENAAIKKKIQERNMQLKRVINETRQFIWDIDRMKGFP
eukprot:Seg1734.9 transcript_id=Seg1734.9/GoldUCD/mRNA.D3Y31 product="hypothetical protein" protein_id=Seg1734.9/GoldUCD/D3Y31